MALVLSRHNQPVDIQLPEVVVSPAFEYWGGHIPQTTPISAGQPVNGAMENLVDENFFSFHAEAGEEYIIIVEPGTLDDSHLTLWDTDFATILAQNDDYDETLASRIVWTAPASGTYYLGVDESDSVICCFGTYPATYTIAIQLATSLSRPPSAVPVTIGWTRQFGSAGNDLASSVAIDVEGNVYVAGTTEGVLVGQVNAGGADAFLRKYEPGGAELWTRQFGFSGDDRVRTVAVDGEGNVYVAYTAWGIKRDQPSPVVDDVFLRKYSPEGDKLWTQQFRTGTNYGVADMTVDGNGNVYVAGINEIVVPDQTKNTDYGQYLRKYDTAGVEVWAHQFGVGGTYAVTSIVVDEDGSIYVAGKTPQVLLDQNGYRPSDAFLSKYDSAMAELWTRQFETDSYDSASSIAVDEEGAVYVVGGAGGALTGDPIEGDGDVYVRKYGNGGTVMWTRQFGTPKIDISLGLAVDAHGSVYIVGQTEGSLPGQYNSGSGLGSFQPFDGYVRKYDSEGLETWTHQFGTSGYDAASGIAVDRDGNVYVAGQTGDTLLGQISAGKQDAFLLQITD